MRNNEISKRAPRKDKTRGSPATQEIRGGQITLDREILRQLRIGREFMAEYREVFEKLAKS